MKVIEQLITYLDVRGLLDEEDREYLRAAGFLPPDRPAGDYDEIDDLLCQLSGEGATDPMRDGDDVWFRAEAQALTQQRRARRRRGARKHPAPTAREIDGWLARRFPAWEEPLGALLPVVRCLAPASGLREAPAALHRVRPEALADALAPCLRLRRPSLKELWTALSLEEYHGAVAAPRHQGPASHAYRRLLRARAYHDLGNSAWILRQPEIAWVFDLIRAQRRLLAACGSLYETDPGLIDRELERERNDGVFWAFAFLYDARRRTLDLEPRLLPRECVVARPWPKQTVWQQAWAQARTMAARTGTPWRGGEDAPGGQAMEAESADETARLWDLWARACAAAREVGSDPMTPGISSAEVCELICPARWRNPYRWDAPAPASSTGSMSPREGNCE